MRVVNYRVEKVWRAFFLFLLLFTAAVGLAAPDVHDASKVKSAYIFNFIQYVKWPNEKAMTTFEIGFYGESKAYYQSLLKMQGKKIRNFKLKVQKVSSLTGNQKLQLLIIDKNKSHSLSNAAEKLRNNSVLLVSDHARDKKNTMLNFVSTTENTLSFELNRYNMLNAKLRVSPDILVLGGTELDIANVLKEMDETISTSLAELGLQSEKLLALRAAIQIREKQLMSQQRQLSDQEKKLLVQNEKLKDQKHKLGQQLNIMAKQTDRIKVQAVELTSNKKKFAALKSDYAEVMKNLEKSQAQLALNTQNLVGLKYEIKDKELSINELSKKITDRKASLQGLYERQAQQEREIVAKEIEIGKNLARMAKQSSVIQTQYSVLIFAGIGLFSVLIMVGVIYHSSREKQRVNKQLQENLNELDAVNKQLKNAQSQLVEAEKMAALGGLVAGVAHEINTPIGVGVTAASILSDRIDQFNVEYQRGQLKRSSLDELLSDAKESSDMILRNLRRASELVRNFKQVAVDQSGEARRKFELKAYLEELSQSLLPQLKRDHHKIIIQANEKINLDSYPGLLAQVMTNLIMNSVIHGFKGRTEGKIHILLELAEGKVSIDYEDNGVGLNDEQREKVFEPFYTTVRGSGGSGLGMSIGYNLVVNKLKGTIACVDSSNGAHFKISFPVS